MTLYVILAIVLLVVIWPYWAESRRVPARAVRDKAPGEFAELSQGVTHYQWIGPARGPVIVAIHGLTTPSPVWYAVAAGLSRIGYRVVVYDLYGRGFSDAAPGKQDRRFFLRQLEDLLDHLGLDDELTLLGYSMGGAVATAFAAENPGRIKRLMLVASAGVVIRESRFDRFCRETPVLGDWLALALGPVRMRRALRARRDAPTEVDGIVAAQLAEIDGRGYHRAVLSSRRHMLDEVQEDEHRLLGREDVPVVAIWGARDKEIPLRALGTLAQWNRLAKSEVIEDADHALVHSHGAILAEILRDVLREVD
ncbi:MAG: putative hydrolases or acyltransferases (alpha/beta hydrolase superfamily) [Rhodobacteraceae bacterium HLUCCA08]|nr:MAG: putative hydrolases or acyltransferases (alpha/beta hydrolase superfamily) [Rhodobacteraceae bacterium HLUCCA08]